MAVQVRGAARRADGGGKPYDWLELGANLQYFDDRGEFEQTAVTGAPIASLPNISYKHGNFRLFGRYAVNRNLGVRLDYVYDRWNIDDWTWTNFVYSDGTRLIQDPKQTVNFVGLTIEYRLW